MAQNKLSMREMKQILRLNNQNKLSVLQIARSCGLATSTIGDYMKRAAAAGIGWPLAEGQGEKELLEQLMATPAPTAGSGEALPDWVSMHKELARKGVTLHLLWQEYRRNHPEAYGDSRFCELYRRWDGTLDCVVRQVHLR